ncbi:hypothetical protein [Streptomyces sp. SP18BB07]|uniref:hypothetical protein n=1 Tax=Streptomyces sp. SP18BB07 TaxID=3002522 RepID=UPI002E76A211|nr:hypothetical protein [Streptomyces sp. SP18BB07]MEE1763539.1 hypothetical protein [Streptomyces sp. SP18BB07]
MSARFILYGMEGWALNEASRSISTALGVEFSVRNSSYKGGDYYFYRGVGRLEISIEENVRDDEGILGEPEFPQFDALVYVNCSISEVERKLSTVEDLQLLRAETI